MNVDQIRSVLVSDGEHLGDLVFWSLSDARIDRAALESLWSTAGLDEALLPDPPSSEKAFKVAVRETAVGQTERLLRLAREDASAIVVAIVREQKTGDGSLDYSTEARIMLDRQREVFSCDCRGHDLVAAVRSRFDAYRMSHHPDDVRRTIVKTLDSMAAVPLRPSGGIYWTPGVFADELRNLQSAIEQVGSSRMFLLPIHRSADAEHALAEIAKGSIEDELAALKSEIAQFLETPPDRASTLLRRFDSYEALRTRAKLYRDVLNVEVDDLDAQLGRLSATVEELLQQKAA